MKKRVNLNTMITFVPIIILFVIFGFFSQGKTVLPNNLLTIVDTAIPILIAGLGVIFVIAQGSLDLSIGSIVGLTGIVGCLMVQKFGVGALLPTMLALGALVGLVNGLIIGKLKVSSFMTTLAMLIGLKGLTNYLLGTTAIYVPSELSVINSYPIKIGVLIGLIVVMAYIFEFTKIGRYSKSIGENETAVKFVGIPVVKTKITVFVISGLMAGLCGFFTLIKLGGPTNSMGSFYEMQVMMAIFLGGVLVTGGTQTKIYKLIVGAFTIVVIQNGLIITMVPTEIASIIQGILLIVILFTTLYLNTDRENKINVKAALKKTDG